MSTKVVYSGNVTIKIKNKKVKKSKNNGTDLLFNTLCELLVDESLSYSKINSKQPKYITISKNENASSPLVASPLVIVNRNIDYTTKTINLSALLTHDNCLSGSENLGNCYIVLLNGGGKPLAYTSIVFDDIKPVFDNVNAQAEIFWELSFENA